MKRTISLLLFLLLLLTLLPACSQSAGEPPAPESEEPATAARGLAEAAFVFSGCGEELNTECLNEDEDSDRLAAYIEAVCSLTGDQWEDAAVVRGMGASAFEILVLHLPDEAAARKIETVLTDYLTVREGAFTGYAPDEAKMASNGRVRREGRTVGLFICPDPAGAEDAFTAAYNGEALPEPEPEPESEPSEEPVQPLFEIHDLLFRLLLEAACPEWRSVEKYWTTNDWMLDDTVTSASGYWAPDDGSEWTAGGSVQIEYDEDNNPTVIQWGLEHMVSVSLMKSEEAALNALDSLTLTLNEQEENYRLRGDEVKAELIANAQVAASGRYAALIISDHAEDAALLFSRAVNDPDTGGFFRRYIDGAQPAVAADPDPDYPDRIRFTPPGEDDMSIYDTSAILDAWESGDPSGLSGDDREIFDAAVSILAEVIRDGMSDLEKETAVYQWLVNNVNYDWSHQDVLEETDRRSYGPYGGLVNRTAVCLGYATSFQLLMDMSGVECITIVGAAFNSTGDHAWNVVRLNGEWYCVDPTWDANRREQLGDSYEWRYFNITSDEMAKNHQWDYANTPEATAEDRGGAQ